MWFRLRATSDYHVMDPYRKYCKELSKFNIRILNIPRIYFSDMVLLMDELVLVELDTLEDFIHLRDSLGKSLILREDYDKLIEIYDDWRE